MPTHTVTTHKYVRGELPVHWRVSVSLREPYTVVTSIFPPSVSQVSIYSYVFKCSTFSENVFVYSAISSAHSSSVLTFYYLFTFICTIFGFCLAYGSLIALSSSLSLHTFCSPLPKSTNMHNYQENAIWILPIFFSVYFSGNGKSLSIYFSSRFVVQ